MKLVYETYVCAGAKGVEWGFTFKREGSDDSVFDLVLGGAPDPTPEEMRMSWDANEWAARAVCVADADFLEREDFLRRLL